MRKNTYKIDRSSIPTVKFYSPEGLQTYKFKAENCATLVAVDRLLTKGLSLYEASLILTFGRGATKDIVKQSMSHVLNDMALKNNKTIGLPLTLI